MKDTLLPKKLLKVKQSSSRRNKVFIRRAIKDGWTEPGIIEALKFGPQHFKLMGDGNYAIRTYQRWVKRVLKNTVVRRK